MPTNRMLKTMNAIHRGLLRTSAGRLGRSFNGMPMLELTTIGRKSGQPRSSMLSAPIVRGSVYVVVASRGGDDVHPAWLLNLQQNPNVRVAVQGGPPVAMRARVASAAERAELWPQVTARWSNYAAYQAKTSREIPLVLLEPAVESGS
jgi:deazaflavin-dependent oxidoreductase (nitroreductase family)